MDMVNSMTCKFLKIQKGGYVGYEDEQIKIISYLCILKSQSENMKLRIYETLLEKGLESDNVSLICPVAHDSNFTECPFCEF
jgi:hypothetical protein